MTKHVMEVRSSGRSALSRMHELLIAATVLNLSWSAALLHDDSGKPLVVLEIDDGKSEELHTKPGGSA